MTEADKTWAKERATAYLAEIRDAVENHDFSGAEITIERALAEAVKRGSEAGTVTGICPAVGYVPSGLQGVTQGSSSGFSPQRCDVCGATVPVDGFMRLTLHARLFAYPGPAPTTDKEPT